MVTVRQMTQKPLRVLEELTFSSFFLLGWIFHSPRKGVFAWKFTLDIHPERVFLLENSPWTFTPWGCFCLKIHPGHSPLACLGFFQLKMSNLSLWQLTLPVSEAVSSKSLLCRLIQASSARGKTSNGVFTYSKDTTAMFRPRFTVGRGGLGTTEWRDSDVRLAGSWKKMAMSCDENKVLSLFWKS